jgi:hypothetical protein
VGLPCQRPRSHLARPRYMERWQGAPRMTEPRDFVCPGPLSSDLPKWVSHRRVLRDCHQVPSGPLIRSRRVRLLVESGPTFTPPDSPRFDKLTEIGPTLNRFRNPQLIGV